MKSKNNVALFDIDNTLYKGGLIYPLMDSELKDGLLNKKIIDKAYENRSSYQKGELKYEEFSRKGVTIWADGLKGQSYNDIVRHTEEFIKRDHRNFYSFTKPLLTLLERTHDRIIITNEPQFVAGQIQKQFNFTNFVSTIFEVKNGIFTGNISRFNSTQIDKKKSLQEVFTKYSRDRTFAFGDSVGDIGMFEEVEFPICVNASEKLRYIALKNNWRLTNPDNILEVIHKILSG